MSYGFRVMIEGERALFSRPELKVERVSYDVPPPGTLEGLLKCVYWKPSIRYCIDKIIVFNKINFANLRRNEVKDKVLFSDIRAQMSGAQKDPCIYASESRTQRASLLLTNVRYGVEFHFELTGIKTEREEDAENKHYNIIKRRLEKGQCFRTPCLGCSEFPVKKLELVDEFPLEEISPEIIAMGDTDLGYMTYCVQFEDGGMPVNSDWESPKFSDRASTVFYRPHMINGIIDVNRYRGDKKC